MSRGRAKMLPPSLTGHRDSGLYNNGLTATVTAPTYNALAANGQDPRHGLTGVGDLMILIHVVDDPTITVGAPSTVGNPWTPVAKPDGSPLDETQAGDASVGSVRLRMWWKLATQTDLDTTAIYQVTATTPTRHGLGIRIVPWAAVGPGTLPLVATVRKAPSGRMHGPDLTIPNVGAQYRNVALHGAVVAYPVNTARSIVYNGRTPTVRYTPTAWAADNASFAGVDPGDKIDPTRFVRYTAAFGLEALAGQPSQRYNDYRSGTNERATNIPHIAAAFLIRPYTYPAPTDGAQWPDVADDFAAPASLDDYDTTGTPTITGGRLELRDGDGILRRSRIDPTRRHLALDVTTHDPTTGARLQLLLTDGTLTGGVGDIRAAISLTSGTDPTYGPVIRWQVYDEGFGGQGLVTYAGLAGRTRYWRVREESGLIAMDFSADAVTWRTGPIVPHTFLPDQLAALRVGLAADTTNPGPPGTVLATLERLNPIRDDVLGVLPLESSFSFMGAPPALRAQWHGRDVLMGVADQGTTREVRAAQNITLLRRRYLFPAPTGGREIHDGAIHGCLVTVCAVPTGGRFVEANVTDGGDSTTADALMLGVLWCVQQGAKVVNCSFGGGGDTPVFAAVFRHIEANYDAELFFSAGNSGAYGIELPAAYSSIYSNVHSVGAWDEFTNLKPGFSTHHEQTSGVAPGNHTGGRLPNGSPVTWRGTSAASPHAAQLCARLLTTTAGRRYTAGQAGVALDRNTRPTGADRAIEGGGAFDLTRAVAGIGNPTGGVNVPGHGMPRFELDQRTGVVDGFNQMAAAVQRAGACAIARYNPIDETGERTWLLRGSGFWNPVAWETADTDSAEGMWDGPVLTAPSDGMYLVVAQLRWGTQLIDGTVATGAPYSVGTRAAAIMLNGTDPVANMVVEDRVAASAAAGGVANLVAAIVPMYTDDWCYINSWQDSGSAIQCFQPEYGGSWCGMARLSDLAPNMEAA